MMKFEDNYIYFVEALKYVINMQGRGCQKGLAYDADVSKSLISMALKPNAVKKPGFLAQQKLANAAGYSYVDFLELGRTVLNKEKKLTQGDRRLCQRRAADKSNNVIQLPHNDRGPPSPEDLVKQDMHQRLDEILDSGHHVLVSAIQSNLIAFSDSVNDKKEKKDMLDRIKRLEGSG